MSTISLVGSYAKTNLLEIIRIPIALIGTIVFPALSLLFFVVPNRQVAENPLFATQAVLSLAVFAVMVNLLFTFGVGIAEDREKPWHPYLRTLPAPPIARILGTLLPTAVFGLAAILPVVLFGGLFTDASAEPLRILAGFGALLIAVPPFAFIGMAIGYSMPAKAAIAVVQVVMFALAFGGGLFLPPQIFAEWLEVLSRFLPSRHARELVVWAVQGGELAWWVWAGLAAWTVSTLVLAIVLFRRDEGRRFR